MTFTVATLYAIQYHKKITLPDWEGYFYWDDNLHKLRFTNPKTGYDCDGVYFNHNEQFRDDWIVFD